MESQPVIEFNKASIFQNETLVLANVSLTVQKGEFVYLIGKKNGEYEKVNFPDSIIFTVLVFLFLPMGMGQSNTYSHTTADLEAIFFH